MPDVTATLTIKAVDQTKGATASAKQSTSDLGLKFTELNSVVSLVKQGFAAAQAVIDETVGKAAAWANTIDKLSRASGENAEKTSQMAIVFEDFGIKADGLDRVIKQFTKNGLQFNLDTIEKLAAQYPVERDKFAFDNFGRSGLELTEILSKTPAQLKAVGDAALYSGKILNDQGVEALQNYSLKANQLGDNIDGIKMSIGEALVPALVTGTDALHTHIAAFELANQALATGAINLGEYFHASFSATEQIDYFNKKINEQKDATNYLEAADRNLLRTEAEHDVAMADNIARHVEIAAALKEEAPLYYATANSVQQLGVNMWGLSDATAAAGQAQLAAAAANAELSKKEELAIASTDKLTKETIFQTAAVGLNADDQLALARSLGLVDEATLKQIRSIDNLKAAHDKGLISTDQFISGVNGVANSTSAAANSVNNLAEQIAALQDKTVTVTVNQNYGGQYGSSGPGYTGNANGNNMTGTGGGSSNPYNGVPGYASGGDFVVPPGYNNDNFMARFTSGEHVNVDNGGGGGDLAAVLINLPAMIGRAVRDAMQLSR